MRIGLFTDSYPPYINGVATSVYNLREALIKMGHVVYIVTVNDSIVKHVYDKEEKILKIPGIPVGIYFYSHANSRKDAINEAKWIMNKIRNYNVSLEIVFDWENWDSFQEYNLSFYKLTDAANAFVKKVEKNGYKGMVYSSKNYLENIWLKLDSRIWLAHYTNETNYQGKYRVWQICNDGIVDGISDNQVDINIRYKK